MFIAKHIQQMNEIRINGDNIGIYNNDKNGKWSIVFNTFNGIQLQVNEDTLGSVFINLSFMHLQSLKDIICTIQNKKMYEYEND